MSRVVVVGAGVGGLAVAARLAVKGHQVTVVEAAESWGGRLGSLRRDGFAFDTGPTTFTLPAVYRDLFAKIGGPLEESVTLLPLEPARRYLFADGTLLDLPGVGVGSAAVAMGEAFGGRAADDWRSLLRDAGQVWATTRTMPGTPPGPHRPAPSQALGPASRPTPDLASGPALPAGTLRDLARARLSDARARQVLEGHALGQGMDPRRVAAAHVTLPYVEATFGTWHLAGGLRTLADALHTRVLERGAEVRTGSRVARILDDDGKVTAVALADGTVLPADVAVISTDPEVQPATPTRTDPPRGGTPGVPGSPGAAPTRLGRLRPAHRTSHPPESAGEFQMHLAVRGRTPDLGHQTVWLPEANDSELDAVFGRSACPAPEPTIRACVPDDPAMRPDGHEAWTIRVAAPPHSPGGRVPGTLDWDEPGRAARYAGHVLDVLARRGTDLAGRVLWSELRTPADHERATAAPGGRIAVPFPLQETAGRSGSAQLDGLVDLDVATPDAGWLARVGLAAEAIAERIGRA